MNRKTLILGVVALFAFGLTHSEARAQSPLGGGIILRLTVSGTSSVQGTDDGGDPIDKIAAPSKLLISTKSLLALAAASPMSTAGGAYSPGSILVLDGSNNGDVEVLDITQDVEDDLTSDGILTVTLDPSSDGVWSGKINNKTTAANYTGQYLSTISFNDGNGTVANLSGLAKETYSFSTPNPISGSQTAVDSITDKVVGDGTSPIVAPGVGVSKNATFSLIFVGVGRETPGATGIEARPTRLSQH